MAEPAARAEAVSRKLAEAPPIPGYKGFTRLTRNVVGSTMTETLRSARGLRPEVEAMTSEAWTTPGSVQAATRIVLRGRGQRMDLQDAHGSAECSAAVSTMLQLQDLASTRSSMAGGSLGSARLSARRRGGGSSGPQAKFPSYDPGAGQVGRINPALLGPAGTVSICNKMETSRLEAYTREKILAIKNNDCPSAIRR
mmetsp:Transcript_53649/g.136111  ORF Transcript_53649/g.136111 Transcript_53649/m.136111 type:complete len:197 (+) Transcript_53649:2-592(+)